MKPSGPSASSFQNDSLTKVGVLNKKCGGLKKWNLRFLVLDKKNKTLYYYHSPRDATPRKALDLNMCDIYRLPPEESASGSGFKIALRGSRAFIFAGTNPTIVEEWVNAILLAKSSQSGMEDTPKGPAQGIQKQAVVEGKSAGRESSIPFEEAPSESKEQHDHQTLVGQQQPESTLVIGQKKPGQVVQTVTQMVTYIIMNPENKRFPPVSKPVTNIIKVGRFVGGQAPSDDIIMFKSKVISRHHAEVWGVNGEVYIRDTKSQSGTFLNAMRLSEAGKESKPYRLKPGDIVQFGVDYKGAQEGNDNAKCISVTIDIKTKMEDVAITNANNGPKSNGECTLVGANQGEGNTLVAAH